MTVCNMAIEGGARAGLIAPDEKTFEYCMGRPHAPKGAQWEAALTWWKTLFSDEDAHWDEILVIKAEDMYFLMIRPQQKKVKQHQAMVAAVRKGDQIVTAGGLIGKVTKVNTDNEVEVEISSGVKVKVVQHTISQVLNKTEPAK